EQARNVFKVLLISPIVGFGASALLLLALKMLLRKPELYESPKGNQPPPFWIRALLVLTCTGVSFGHGSNDGQKGMGLIMLILIGTVPPAYALNHAIGIDQMHEFIAVSQQAEQVLNRAIARSAAPGARSADPRAELTASIQTRHLTPAALPALRQMIDKIDQEVVLYKSLSSVPASQQQNVRNDMYVVSESLHLLARSGQPIDSAGAAVLANYKKQLDRSTKYIPSWVKVAVALALGLGTMVGWKRVVITVGERIGKEHLTYAQGAAAQIVAACTILAADIFHMPVSTTHVLSSGVAGTMSANGSGLQFATIRNIALAWVFTLPAAALLAGGIFLVMYRFV
ncbi:MAG TPA: inorganic phosphate transporter, partial [Acidobacteriaceae bacterium]